MWIGCCGGLKGILRMMGCFLVRFALFTLHVICQCVVGWYLLTGLSLCIDEAELRALDEFVSQEEAFEMALQEQESLANRHGLAEPDAPFSDAEYDDIFMHLSEPAQDMDMS